MDSWRDKAIEYFPNLRDEIAQQANPMGLWILLFNTLQNAYDEPIDEKCIRKIYNFAWWCFEQPSTSDAETDLGSAAAVGFIESIPLDERISADLHRWISEDNFHGFEALFRYHLDDEKYRKFAANFFERKRNLNQG